MDNEIDKKQLAERLRSIKNKIGFVSVSKNARMELEGVIEELDPPPRLEPGTVVWWQPSKYNEKRYGIVVSDISEVTSVMTDTGGELFWEELGQRGIDWGVCNILGPRQIGVPFTPVSEWRDDVVMVTYSRHWHLKNGGILSDCDLYHISRKQAERMEASDDK